MLYALIAVHAVLGALTPLLVRGLRDRVFYVLMLGPLAAAIWLTAQAPLILAGGTYVFTARWIPSLDVDLTLRMGLIQWVLAMIVTWIGTLVLLYSRWYFQGMTVGRSAAILTAFAGAMLGLVTADNLVVLFVFWELTTVFSYLLIGHDPRRRANRGAAQTALIVTTSGGLAMLVGIVAVWQASGTLSLEQIAANPPVGALATAGALLMLVGALTKSALVPFHFWLPGAMAAPTPISAYLHAAAMVKAGVYLVAVLAPSFATVPFWRPTIMLLGTATLIVGGWRALRQTDLKLLLAYGTVSQLGFMVLLLGIGTQAAALAGIGTVIAHALFKSALFMIVGVIDHSATSASSTASATACRGLRSSAGSPRCRWPASSRSSGSSPRRRRSRPSSTSSAGISPTSRRCPRWRSPSRSSSARRSPWPTRCAGGGARSRRRTAPRR